MRIFNFLSRLILTFLFFGVITDFAHAEISGKTLFDLENLCRNNHYESCGHLGVYFRDNIKDPKRAIPFFEKACLGGRAGSCMHLSSLFTNLIPDLEKRFLFAKKACELDEPIGCVMAGLTLANDYNDEKSSAKFLKIGCEGKNGTGCHFLGEYYESESQKDISYKPLAIEAYKKACNLKMQGSCAKLKAIQNEKNLERECAINNSLLQKNCESKDCSNEIVSSIQKGCLIEEELILAMLEKNCLKFKSNSCHEAAGYHLVRGRFDDSLNFSAWSCKSGNPFSCSINKFSEAMLSNNVDRVKKISEELVSGCFTKNLFGDCDLVFTLAKNKNFILGVDLKKLSEKGCDLGSPALCYSFAQFINQKDKKIKILRKSCDLENKIACFESGKLLKDGSLFDKIEAVKILRLGCQGHELDNPIEFGCGELAILEAELQSMIPSTKNIGVVLIFIIILFFSIYGLLRLRKRARALKALEEKTLALEGEFNKKRKEEILSALDKIE